MQHEPDERVDGLPLEVAHRIAVAERRRRGRRAVDHHEPEGDEAERDERDEPLVARARPPSCELLHERAERLAARLEVAELVEARARRREQDDVAGRGRRGGLRDRVLERRRMRERDACDAERLRDLLAPPRRSR